MRIVVAWLASIALVTTPATAHAHKPWVLESATPFDLAEPGVSWALYGVFTNASEIFTVRLSLTGGLATPFEMLVPRQDELRAHRPAFALVGPGLPAPSADEAAALPRSLPPGTGAIVELNLADPREIVFESFLRRVYLSSGITALVLPPGDLEIWIWSPRGTLGKFVLAFGVEEGSQDLCNIFEHWGTYAY